MQVATRTRVPGLQELVVRHLLPPATVALWPLVPVQTRVLAVLVEHSHCLQATVATLTKRAAPQALLATCL